MAYIPLLVSVFVTILKLDISDTALVNVALGKPSTQVHDLHDRAKSHLANDGNPSQSFQAGGCTQTKTLYPTWWMVDLIYTYDINTIRILNRNTDTERLTDFYVYVSTEVPTSMAGSNRSGQLCLHHLGTLSSHGIQELHCTKTLKGRFVYVWKLANGPLTICDFQVVVDMKSKHMVCKIFNDTRVALTPVYSEILTSISMTNCLLTCASAPERDASLLQIYKRSGKCECIQLSEFNSNSNSFDPLSDIDFDVCLLTETITVN